MSRAWNDRGSRCTTHPVTTIHGIKGRRPGRSGLVDEVEPDTISSGTMQTNNPIDKPAMPDPPAPVASPRWMT
jgi:hypothetical protein